MKRTLLVIALLLSAGVILFAGSRQQSGGMTIKQGVLSIGMDIGYPPMEYYGSDGITPIGFDVEMGKALAAKMGLRAEFVNTAWDGIFAGVETNRYDVIMSSVTITDARLRAHNFSKPYIANTLAMVVLKNSPPPARNPLETAGLNVAFQADTTADFYMEELAANTGLRYIPRRYDQVLHCFSELEMGRVDVIVTDLLVAYEYIARPNSPFEIVWRSPEPEVFGICIKRGNDALTTAINSALTELFNDGTMLRISREIFSGMDLVTEARQQW
ncbi:MAG: ABC transporter substrate-binding protein [Treponema sp.]|jgi:polar amino acid transport system substrate-binding protein|nr:ABC transporter substrate-binding protein [Treponema sp.]